MEEHEIGDVWKAQIMAWLWDKRPRSQDLNAEELSEATGIRPMDDVDDFFDDLIDWLVETGLIFLKHDERVNGQAFSVQLTARAIGQMQRQEDGFTGKVGGWAGRILDKLPDAIATASVTLALSALQALQASA